MTAYRLRHIDIGPLHLSSSRPIASTHQLQGKLHVSLHLGEASKCATSLSIGIRGVFCGPGHAGAWKSCCKVAARVTTSEGATHQLVAAAVQLRVDELLSADDALLENLQPLHQMLHLHIHPPVHFKPLSHCTLGAAPRAPPTPSQKSNVSSSCVLASRLCCTQTIRKVMPTMYGHAKSHAQSGIRIQG